MSNIAPVIWLSDLDTESPDLSKHTNQLAQLTQAKFPIPPSFIITTTSYFNFLRDNKLDHKIKQLLSTISFDHADSLMQAEYHIKQLFEKAELSKDFIDEIKKFYNQLEIDTVTLSVYENGGHGRKHNEKNADTAESLVNQITTLWAEMFTGNALWLRDRHGISHVQAGAEILVQEEIRTDKKGTVTTIDPQTHQKDRIVITIQYLNETNKYFLSKRNLSILDRSLENKSNLGKLTHDEILAIANMAKRVENHLYFPQEIVWAIEGKNLYLIAIKSVSTLPHKPNEPKRRLPIARGNGASAMIGTGIVAIIQTQFDLERVKQYQIVVLPELTTKHLRHLKKVRGVIVESGHPRSEIAIMLRQHGIPAIFQVKNAAKLRNGHVVTIHGKKGEIYQGGFL